MTQIVLPGLDRLPSFFYLFKGGDHHIEIILCIYVAATALNPQSRRDCMVPAVYMSKGLLNTPQ